MPSPQDVYVNCDVLENLPEENRENWLFEMTVLEKELPKNAKVLQIGSMDATRIIKLLEIRPDLKMTGLEIEPPLVDIARERIATVKRDTHIVQGDITHPPQLAKFDVVICLNNTFVMKDFTRVKRYTQQEVESWKGRTIKTQLGYFCVLDSKSLNNAILK